MVALEVIVTKMVAAEAVALEVIVAKTVKKIKKPETMPPAHFMIYSERSNFLLIFSGQ